MTSQPKEYALRAAGHACRVLEAGAGAPVVFFAGIGGVPRWSPFLDALSETHRVLVPSLPGFPGAPEFRHLDDYYDWVLATLELFEQLDTGDTNLLGSSVGGALAAEIAALLPGRVRRLALIAPFGLFDEAEPPADPWALPPAPDALPALVCAHPQNWQTLWQKPENVEAVEWGIVLTRSLEAAARYLFPFGDTRLVRRLHRITSPTLLLRGAEDRLMPASYQQRIAEGIRGPVQSDVVPGAGHLVELDQPEELARRIHAFVSDQTFTARNAVRSDRA